MAKAVKIMSIVAKIFLIISLIGHALASLVLVGIPGLIVSIIALKKLSSGSSIVMGVLTFIFADPTAGILTIVIAILSKKLAAADEYAEEAEELVEE